MSLHPDQDVRVLSDEDELADHEYEGELAEDIIFLASNAGIKVCPDHGECDHDAEMEGFAGTFEDAVDTETNIVESDLQPVEPEEGEETNVGFYGCDQ